MDDKDDQKHNPSDNLKPFKSGADWKGNANGRPKGSKNRSTIIKEMIERASLESFKQSQTEFLGDDPEAQPQTVAEQMTAAIVAKAMSGDVPAFRELMDGAYGKLTDKVDNTHSFSKMGRVKAQPIGAEGDEREPESIDLTFDVGKAAPEPEEEQ